MGYLRTSAWQQGCVGAPSVPCLAAAALDTRLVLAAVASIADIGEPAGGRQSCMAVEPSCSALPIEGLIVEFVVRRCATLRAIRLWTRHRLR